MAALHELADLTASDSVCGIVIMVEQQQNLHMLCRRKMCAPPFEMFKAFIKLQIV
jgi:hypothetical protein